MILFFSVYLCVLCGENFFPGDTHLQIALIFANNYNLKI
ncbi:MAG: hypothetical protein QOC96_1652 [Acidobacteriota bacterium]|jgi:hypothetical protein|nr:hypothetical protein [Acidobacteriota bacterium]